MKSQYEGTCPVCSAEWKVNDEIFLSKVNGSWIKCTDKECFEQQGGKIEQPKKFTSTKVPISEAPQIYNMAEKLLQSFKLTRENKSVSPPELPVLTFDQEIDFLKSVFDTLSTEYKP